MTFEEQYDPVDIEDYFAHYGRKGMKWYQHIFGEVQSHAKYAKKGNSTKSKSKNKDQKKVKVKISKKSYKQLSDEDLQRRINRLRNEKEYLELTRVTRRAGKRAVVSVLGAVGKGTLRVIEDQTKNVGNRIVGQIISDLLDEEKKKK